MKTIDLCGRESPDSICAFPDIFEDDEFEVDNMAFGIEVKLERTDDKPVHDGTEYIDEDPRQEKKLVFVWLWRLCLSMFRRCGGRLTDPVKSAGRSVHLDCRSQGRRPRSCSVSSC